MKSKVEGVFDAHRWPDSLTARVVDPTGSSRLHGYAVRSDLALHCTHSEVSWLASRGELPSVHEREPFEVALILLAPVHVGEAAGHSAILARTIAAASPAIVAVAATALAEQVQYELSQFVELFSWLDGEIDEIPSSFLDPNPEIDDVEAHPWFQAQISRWFGESHRLASMPLLKRTALGYALLHCLGITDQLSIGALLVSARLPVVIAEATRVRAGDVMGYPARLPDYVYVDDEVTS